MGVDVKGKGGSDKRSCVGEAFTSQTIDDLFLYKKDQMRYGM